MKPFTALVLAATLAVAAAAPQSATAQAWPTKPLRLIVPYAPGGTPEQMADMIRDEIQRWGPIVKASGAKVD